MNELLGISVVLPSLDPDEKLAAVIDGLLAQGFEDIILVNDGSKPENLHYFEEAATHPQVQLLHHPVNRGKGTALKTAFAWFLENRPDAVGVVTVDGDNQHHPNDTVACCLEMKKTGKVILGCRDFSLPHVPPRSRMGNRITCTVFKLLCNMTISDTQTGLRAIPSDAVRTFLGVKGDRFEYETNMLLAMKEQDIPYGEVKIQTVYIEENKSSHFRTVRDSCRIYRLILAHFFRYILSSLASSVVDTVGFFVLNFLFSNILSGFPLMVATAGLSRLISSLMNFYTNRKLVFHAKNKTGTAMTRYFILAGVQLVVQMLMTYGVYALFNIADDAHLLRTVIYCLVMCVLFMASYMIQQRWVFAPGEKEKE